MAGIVLAALVVTAVPAHAFASVPGQDVHGAITEEAAGLAGWPAGATTTLMAAVVQPDQDETAWDPEADEPTGIRLKETYRSEHHCDRIPPDSDAAALAATIRYIRHEAAAARDATDAAAATSAAGRALHALQDCLSHTDLVDQPASLQQQAAEALLGTGAPPPLRLAAVDPAHDPPGDPPDPYPHDQYALDWAGQNDHAQEELPDGRTRFEAARSAAVDLSTRLLTDILEGMDPAVAAGLRGLDEQQDAPRPGFGVPAPSLPLVAGAVLAFAATRRRASKGHGP